MTSAFRQDLRFAVRTLSKSPIFSTVAILSLALGIGVNTAIFSFIDRLLIRSLPVQDPEQLVLLDHTGGYSGRVENSQAFSYVEYRELRDHNDVFSGTLARYNTNANVTWQKQTEPAVTELVTGNYFDVLGVTPYIGRLITPDDDRIPGMHSVAVLSYGYWTRRFGADASVLNQKILVNGNPMQVIGIAPARFEGLEIGENMDVFVPMMMKAQVTPTSDNDFNNRRNWWLNIFARLKPGITREQAAARLQPLFSRINQDFIDSIPDGSPRMRRVFQGKKILATPGYQGRSSVRKGLSEPLIILMCMVGVVLLIACANVANLLMARAAARQKEIAIRLALGASRWHLIRQLFAESLLLAFCGGVVGVIISFWTVDALLRLFTNTTPLNWASPDTRVLGFTLVVSVITAVVFGLVPAWKTTRPAVSSTLKDQAGSVSAASGDVRLRKGLVVAQVALSLLLLFGASLFVRSLQNLRTVNPGFRTEQLLTFSLDPTLNGYNARRTRDFHFGMQRSLATLPGVRSVTMGDNPLLAGNVSSATVSVEGYRSGEEEDMNPDLNFITPHYFSTLGVPLLAGREFNDADNVPGAPKVAIINKLMADRYFKDRSPLGFKIGIGRNKPDMVIVGVVGNIRGTNMRDEKRRFFYMPVGQNPNPSGLTYYVRAAGAPEHIASAVRSELQRADSTLPVVGMRSMEAQIDETLVAERAVAGMSAFFGLLATVLAAVGLYGVMAYTVTRRTREIGIRVALGAERRRVIGLVLSEVGLMTGIGIALGLPLAVSLSRFIASQLYGLTAHDPVSLTIAISTMLAVSFLAGFIPANRAARIDPIRALRYE